MGTGPFPPARRRSAWLAAVTGPLRAAAAGLLDAALPQTCVACGSWLPGGDGPACPECTAEIAAAAGLPACPRCGRTLPATAIHGRWCARCRTERHWNVAGVVRVAPYTPAVRSLILDLKYGGAERSAEYLADLLAAALRRRGWAAAIDALVPVPMHWLRRWQRPCDHARLLAAAVAGRLRLPVLRLVRRALHRPSQTHLRTRRQRFENVRGCFAPPRWRKLDLAGWRVCILDNLLVTGATVCEVAKVLRKAGARQIGVAVVARPPAPGDPPGGPLEGAGGGDADRAGAGTEGERAPA